VTIDLDRTKEGLMGRRRIISSPRDRRRKQAAGAAKPDRDLAALPLHQELAKKLEGMPLDLGIALVGLGAVGVLIPGPIPLGTTYLVVGVAFLWPGLVARFGGFLTKRAPAILHILIAFLNHLRFGLKRRYPGALRA
jgi:hypothetical protein